MFDFNKSCLGLEFRFLLKYSKKRARSINKLSFRFGCAVERGYLQVALELCIK